MINFLFVLLFISSSELFASAEQDFIVKKTRFNLSTQFGQMKVKDLETGASENFLTDIGIVFEAKKYFQIRPKLRLVSFLNYGIIPIQKTSNRNYNRSSYNTLGLAIYPIYRLSKIYHLGAGVAYNNTLFIQGQDEAVNLETSFVIEPTVFFRGKAKKAFYYYVYLAKPLQVSAGDENYSSSLSTQFKLEYLGIKVNGWPLGIGIQYQTQKFTSQNYEQENKLIKFELATVFDF